MGTHRHVLLDAAECEYIRYSRGFALGYDEAAPSPFVTWQFTETGTGQRDYYWGHYHSDGQTAEKDFAKRIDDYKELFQVQERTSGREPAEYYRYYSPQRPVDLGTFPKPLGNAPVEIINFDERRMVEGGTMRAWGALSGPGCEGGQGQEPERSDTCDCSP